MTRAMKSIAQTLVTTAAVLMVIMTSARGNHIPCDLLCSDPDLRAQQEDSSFHHCRCEHLASTPQPASLTTDVCDYLCSIQMGGQACECSRPSLPGKK